MLIFSLLANNFVCRVLDDLVMPTKKLVLADAEIVLLTALIVLDPGTLFVDYSFVLKAKL